jgi:hypothetical protein
MVSHVITAVTAKFQMIAPKKGNLNLTSNINYESVCTIFISIFAISYVLDSFGAADVEFFGIKNFSSNFSSQIHI